MRKLGTRRLFRTLVLTPEFWLMKRKSADSLLTQGQPFLFHSIIHQFPAQCALLDGNLLVWIRRVVVDNRRKRGLLQYFT